MTQPNQPGQAVAMLQAAGFTLEQVQQMFRAVIPDIQTIVGSEQTLQALAERLAGNGLTPDMALEWGHQVARSFDGHPTAKAFVLDELVPQLHGGGGISAAEGARMARQLHALLTEIRTPPTSYVDTTARIAPSRYAPPKPPTTTEAESVPEALEV